MKKFTELFEEGLQAADHRKKIFNLLIEKTRNVILPRFCETAEELGYVEIYMTLHTKTFSGQEVSTANQYQDEEYLLAIDVQNKSLNDCKYDYCKEEYYIPNGWNWTQIEDASFHKGGIIEFVEEINHRIEVIISKRKADSEKAETLLKDK